jgi:anaphase-promoting complex subunit 11
MKITYTSYTAVAEWKWDLPEEADDTCGICRVQFEGTCAKCKYPGQDCPISRALSAFSAELC